MKRLLVLVPLVLALAAPASASARAAALTAETPQLAADYAAAIAYWGVPDGPEWCATVTASTQAADPSDGEAGHADVPTHFGDDCGFVVDAGLRACEQVGIVRHEVGHLLGEGHSADPASPMYGGAEHVWPDCAAEESAAATSTLTTQLASYEGWLRREVRRCRHKRHRRAECFAFVQEIRAEVAARRSALASG